MKKELVQLLSIIGAITGEYLFDYDFIMDPEVNDCLIKMYFFMMTGDGHPDHDKYYNEFLHSYYSLNEKQQEIVRNDFINIIEAQDKNEQEKVKRKGEMKYE